MLSDENRETAIGHGVGGLLLWEWCGGRGLSVASSHLDAFQYSIITLAGVLFFLPERQASANLTGSMQSYHHPS